MKIYDKKLAYPYFVWMTLFTVVPLLIVVYYAFTDGNGAFTMENLASISGYGSVFARSLLLALIATVICLVLAFPIGYFLSRLRVNKQHIMLMLVMLPMWMNFLLRTYAWMGLLSVNGPVNAILGFFGLGPYNMLNTSGAVVLGMVYNYVPYMILPLYTSMTKIDQSLGHRPAASAGRDRAGAQRGRGSGDLHPLQERKIRPAHRKSGKRRGFGQPDGRFRAGRSDCGPADHHAGGPDGRGRRRGIAAHPAA